MEICHEEKSGRGRFVTGPPGAEAELSYRMADERTASFDHTYVPPARRGSGIAAALVAEGVRWARENRLAVLPRCSFVRAEFQRKPEYRDVAGR